MPSRGAAVLTGAGALMVAFRLSGARAQTETGTGGSPSKRGLPGSLEDTPKIDAWIRIDASGAVTIITGKAELGQGLETALLQVAAEEPGLVGPPDAGHGGYRADAERRLRPQATRCRIGHGNSARRGRRRGEILVAEAARRLGVAATSRCRSATARY